MNLEQWRAQQQGGEEFTLPSGLEVRLKKVALIDLVHGGQIPGDLRTQVAEMTGRRTDQAVSLEDLEKYGPVLDLVAGACIVEPEELKATELPYADKDAIFRWANQAAQALKPFRRQQGADVESAFAVGDVQPAAKPGDRPN